MDVPQFVVRPPIRCFHRRDDPAGAACGAVATWLRVGKTGVETGFFCDNHREDDDTPIPAVPLCRRVSVTLEVLISGTSFAPALAQAEAVALLEGAVGSVGGVVSLHAVHSTIGRYGPRPAKGRPAAGGPVGV